MICPRCGETNAETIPLCDNCGAFLKDQLDSLTSGDAPGRLFAGEGGEESALLPIDELPTVRVPSVPGAASFEPAPQLPFNQNFPLDLDLGQPVTLIQQVDADETLAQAGADVTAAPISSQPTLVFPPDASAGPLLASAFPFNALDLAGSPIAPISHIGMTGMLSLPSRSKTSCSESIASTPPSAPTCPTRLPRAGEPCATRRSGF